MADNNLEQLNKFADGLYFLIEGKLKEDLNKLKNEVLQGIKKDIENSKSELVKVKNEIDKAKADIQQFLNNTINQKLQDINKKLNSYITNQILENKLGEKDKEIKNLINQLQAQLKLLDENIKTLNTTFAGEINTLEQSMSDFKLKHISKIEEKINKIELIFNGIVGIINNNLKNNNK